MPGLQTLTGNGLLIIGGVLVYDSSGRCCCERVASGSQSYGSDISYESVSGGGPPPPPGMRANMSSWWDLSSAPATYLDQHGTWDLAKQGAVTSVALSGPGGQTTVLFNGNTERYIETLVSPIDYYVGFSFSCWVRFDQFAIGGNYIMGHDGASSGFRYFDVTTNSTAGNKIRFRLFDDDGSDIREVSALASPSLSTWYHVVGTSNGAGIELFIDTVSQGTDTAIMGLLSVKDAPFAIGQTPTATAPSTNHRGNIAMVGTWNRVIDIDEIDALYNSGAGLQYSTIPV
jgi:hypothetical protein